MKFSHDVSSLSSHFSNTDLFFTSVLNLALRTGFDCDREEMKECLMLTSDDNFLEPFSHKMFWI